MSGEGWNATSPPSPSITMRPHFRVARMAVARASAMGRAVDRALDAVAAGQVADLATLSGPDGEDRVAQAEVPGEPHPLLDHVDADD